MITKNIISIFKEYICSLAVKDREAFDIYCLGKNTDTPMTLDEYCEQLHKFFHDELQREGVRVGLTYSSKKIVAGRPHDVAPYAFQHAVFFNPYDMSIVSMKRYLDLGYLLFNLGIVFLLHPVFNDSILKSVNVHAESGTIKTYYICENEDCLYQLDILVRGWEATLRKDYRLFFSQSYKFNTHVKYRYANYEEIYIQDSGLTNKELKELHIYTNHMFGPHLLVYEDE